LYLKDIYDFLDPRLVEILPKKLERWLPKATQPTAEEFEAMRDYFCTTDYPKWE
jgi:hypothetical protein